MGKLIMHSMYPGKQVSDLQESDKQIISALITLAAGLAGGGPAAVAPVRWPALRQGKCG